MKKVDFKNILNEKIPEISVGLKDEIKQFIAKMSEEPKKQVIYLAQFAVILTIFSYLSFFVALPDARGVWYILSSLSSVVLWCMYLTKFFEKRECSILVAIVIALSIRNTQSAIVDVQNVGDVLFGMGAVWLGLFLSIASIVVEVFAVKSALTGLKNKRAIKTATILSVIVEASLLIMILVLSPDFVENERILKLFTIIFGIIGRCCLSVSIFLFAQRNTIPKVIFKTKNVKNDRIKEAEYKLKDLQNKFEFGLISKEEYQEKRNEIIRDL